ncbi:MAG TPA: hypothetical protein VFG77_00465 [Nitrososphaeraceae archaeon]|nr:hypothetical protein [Nitrososphaeraceae archaeon]
MTYTYASSDGNDGGDNDDQLEPQQDDNIGGNDGSSESENSGFMGEEGGSEDSSNSDDNMGNEDQVQDDNEEICDNGIDDNGDGLIDQQDPITCPDENEEICDNGIDDNNDGLVDKDDLAACSDENKEEESRGAEQGGIAPGQVGPQGELLPPSGMGGNGEGVGGKETLFGGGNKQPLSEEQGFGTVAGEICDDGVDNDGDNLVDLADDECAGTQTQAAATTMTYEDWHNNCIGMAGFGGCPISPPCNSPPPPNMIETLNYEKPALHYKRNYRSSQILYLKNIA